MRFAGAEIGFARDAQRLAQLLEVLLVRERGRLVEPLRHHQLGAWRPSTRASADLGLDAHEGLRAARDRGGAEAKRQAQRDRALEQLDAAQAQAPRRSSLMQRLQQAPRT